MARTPIKDLSGAAVNVTPTDYDWSQGYPEKWEYWEAVNCSGCGKTLCPVTGEEQHRYLDEESTCEGYVNSDGPMMNYYYELPSFEWQLRQLGSIEDAARRIAHLSLCIVRFEESEGYALALTGGGMDLSWEICEAYMQLGYLPPSHFSLPSMAGYTYTARRRWVLAGVAATARVRLNHARHDLEAVKRMRDYLKQNTADQRERAAA